MTMVKGQGCGVLTISNYVEKSAPAAVRLSLHYAPHTLCLSSLCVVSAAAFPKPYLAATPHEHKYS